MLTWIGDDRQTWRLLVGRTGDAVRTVRGDLLKMALAGEFDVIVHGANCFCTMGAGMPKPFESSFRRHTRPISRRLRAFAPSYYYCGTFVQRREVRCTR